MAVISDEVVAALGDPAEIERAIAAFELSARALSRQRAHLRKVSPGRWVAMVGECVAFDGPTFESVAEALKAEGLEPAHTVMEFIESHPNPMIL